jgi:hypothetical protein
MATNAKHLPSKKHLLVIDPDSLLEMDIEDLSAFKLLGTDEGYLFFCPELFFLKLHSI